MALICALISLSASDAAAQDHLVEERLRDAVMTFISWDGADFVLSDVRVTGTLPEGDWTLEIASTENLRTRVRARVVSFETTDHQPERASAWVSANISITLPVMVANRAIPAGARVGQHLRTELRELAGLPQGFVTDRSSVESLIARRALREGEPIRTSFLERPRLVSRSQIVTVQVQRGRVVLTATGIALEDGRSGDAIRVRNLDSDTVFSALVRAEGFVEVP